LVDLDHTGRQSLHGELHDGVHNIVVVGLQGLDSLGTAAVSLGNNELNVLAADTLLINLLLILISSGGRGTGLDILASILENLLGSLELGLQAVDILGLTLAKDNVSVRVEGLEDIGLGDGQNGLARATDRHAGDALDLLETELAEGLASLDLTTGLDAGGGGLLLRVGLGARVDLLDGGGLVLDIGPENDSTRTKNGQTWISLTMLFEKRKSPLSLK